MTDFFAEHVKVIPVAMPKRAVRTPVGTVKVDGRYFIAMFPDSRGVRTDELKPGTRVLLPGRIVRTVSDISETCWENAKGQTILRVGYVEGNTPEWSAANTAAPGTMWKVEVAS